MSQLSLMFKDRVLSIHELDPEQESIIGHEAHCQIHIDSLAVQPEHAAISSIDDTFFVTPISSDTEVFVNDQQISKQTRLCDRDIINLGKHTLVLNLNQAKNNSVTDEHPIETDTVIQRAAWIQFLNGSDMGKTMPINSMININHQDEDIALISKRKDGFYLTHLKGKNPPRMNNKNIGDKSVFLENKSQINIGPLELIFHLDEQL